MALDTTKRVELAAALRDAGGLDQEQKSVLLGLLNERKRYGLMWEDKPEDAYEKLRTELPVFTEVPERHIAGASPDSPDHILIEGDNLHALTALQYTHAGMVDVIYIDPPYNTGNKDFSYNDTFVDKEDTWRHSKWLSFMEKRLKLAKELLKETGVIFISIDDYSYAQIKILCDAIFEFSNNPDRWNKLATLIWDKQHSQQQGIFKQYHEYILVYAKNKDLLANIGGGSGVIEAGALKKVSSKNPASTFEFPAGTRFDADNGVELAGTFGDSEKVKVVAGRFIAENGKTKYPVTLEAGWTQKSQMKSWFSGSETIDSKGQKVLEFFFNSKGKLKCTKARVAITPPTFLPEYGMVSEQTAALESIMGQSETFSNPKPVKMIQDFISWFTPEGTELILDFFAGSGTTLHATMALNAEDGGKRQCILVTNNENDICEKVTYERNKRVIHGYTNAKGQAVEGLVNNTLRYYKTEFVPREPTLKNRREFVKRAVELIAIKENAFHVRTDLSGPSYTVIEAKNAFAFVVADPDAVPDVVDCIRDLGKPCKVYVFSPGNYAWDEDFEEVRHKVELIPMPEAVYAALENELPKRSLVSEAAQ